MSFWRVALRERRCGVRERLNGLTMIDSRMIELFEGE